MDLRRDLKAEHPFRYIADLDVARHIEGGMRARIAETVRQTGLPEWEVRSMLLPHHLRATNRMAHEAVDYRNERIMALLEHARTYVNFPREVAPTPIVPIDPVCADDPIAHFLTTAASTPMYETILEIGTGKGDGSTRFLYDGVISREHPVEIVTYDAYKPHFEEAVSKWDGNPYVKCVFGRVLPGSRLPLWREVCDVFGEANINVREHAMDVQNAIYNAPHVPVYFRVDLLYLDGGTYFTYFDYLEFKDEALCIIIRGINHIKGRRIYDELNADRVTWHRVTHDRRGPHGFAMFRRNRNETRAVNATARRLPAPLSRNRHELPAPVPGNAALPAPTPLTLTQTRLGLGQGPTVAPGYAAAVSAAASIPPSRTGSPLPLVAMLGEVARPPSPGLDEGLLRGTLGRGVPVPGGAARVFTTPVAAASTTYASSAVNIPVDGSHDRTVHPSTFTTPDPRRVASYDTTPVQAQIAVMQPPETTPLREEGVAVPVPVGHYHSSGAMFEEQVTALEVRLNASLASAFEPVNQKIDALANNILMTNNRLNAIEPIVHEQSQRLAGLARGFGGARSSGQASATRTQSFAPGSARGAPTRVVLQTSSEGGSATDTQQGVQSPPPAPTFATATGESHEAQHPAADGNASNNSSERTTL